MNCDRPDCTEEAITNLDGENLCREHADEWARNERLDWIETQEMEETECL